MDESARINNPKGGVFLIFWNEGPLRIEAEEGCGKGCLRACLLLYIRSDTRIARPSLAKGNALLISAKGNVCEMILSNG